MRARSGVPACLLGLFVAASAASMAAAAEREVRTLERLERKLEALEKRVERAEAQHRKDAEKIHALEKEIARLKIAAAVPPPQPPPAPVQTRLNVFNPRATVFGNGLLRLDDRKVFLTDGTSKQRIDSRFNLREAELDFRAAIDPFADGVVIATLESDVPGEFSVGVEEGYALIKNLPFLSRPPLGMRLKVGRFRSEFGRFNRLHTHDLPQSTRPLAVQTFLGPEGHAANGLSGRFLLPVPFDEESAVELTLQAFSGGDIAVAPGTNDPGLLGNLRWSRTFAGVHSADLSAIVHYGHSDPAGRLPVTTYSVDGLYKWKPLRRGEWRSFLLGGQLFFSDRRFLPPVHSGADALRARTTHPLGYFVFGQYQLSRRLMAGVRWDWTEDIANDARTTMAVQPYVSYYFSEFLRLRLGLEHRWSDLPGEDGRNTALLETNFVFGSHPTEPFWVNR